MSGHFFRNDGPCIWCKAPRDRVQDRRAPPWCDERPDDVELPSERRDRPSSNEYTGY